MSPLRLRKRTEKIRELKGIVVLWFFNLMTLTKSAEKSMGVKDVFFAISPCGGSAKILTLCGVSFPLLL